MEASRTLFALRCALWSPCPASPTVTLSQRKSTKTQCFAFVDCYFCVTPRPAEPAQVCDIVAAPGGAGAHQVATGHHSC